MTSLIHMPELNSTNFKLNRRVAAILILACIMAVSPLQASAEKKKDSKEREAARRVMQMQQQMEAEKADLQSQIDKEKQNAEASKKDADVLKESLAVSSHRSSTLAKELEQIKREKTELEAKLNDTQSALDTSNMRLDDLNGRYSIAQNTIQSDESQNKTLINNMTLKQQRLASCEEKNIKLHDFGVELVKMYENPGLYQTILRKEPFTQIKHVELENIVQDYRDKLDDQRINPAQN